MFGSLAKVEVLAIFFCMQSSTGFKRVIFGLILNGKVVRIMNPKKQVSHYSGWMILFFLFWIIVPWDAVLHRSSEMVMMWKVAADPRLVGFCPHTSVCMWSSDDCKTYHQVVKSTYWSCKLREQMPLLLLSQAYISHWLKPIRLPQKEHGSEAEEIPRTACITQSLKSPRLIIFLEPLFKLGQHSKQFWSVETCLITHINQP